MARKQDVKAAAKARKQKIILIVFGVALLGVGALQGPKLLKHGSSPATEAASTTVTGTSPDVAVVAVAPAGVAVAGTSSGTVAVASLAGVQIRNTGEVTADENQLWSFSTFDPKDPFVPQGAAKPPPEEETTSDEKPPDDSAGTDPSAQATPVQEPPVQEPPVQEPPVQEPPVQEPPVQEPPVQEPPVQEPPVQEPVAPVPEPVVPPKASFATIEVNGAAQHLAPRDTFPKLAPVFVLKGLKLESAKIGVAGGSFSGGKTADLKLGKRLTAVDTATGVRYVLKLVYVGPEPEVVKAFTSGSEKQPAASGK